MSNVRAFVLAVLTGTLVGAFPGLLLTVPMGIEEYFRPFGTSGIKIMLLPVMIAAPLVLAACLLVGLPLTVVLARTGREESHYYPLAGMIVGAVPFFVLDMIPDIEGTFSHFGLIGLFAGAATGLVWGRHREAVKSANMDSGHR